MRTPRDQWSLGALVESAGLTRLFGVQQAHRYEARTEERNGSQHASNSSGAAECRFFGPIGCCQDRACWGRLGLAQVGVRSAGASA